MPAWLINLLVTFAVKFGLPWLLDLLAKKFPWLPAEVTAAIKELVEKLTGAKEVRKEAKREATALRLAALKKARKRIVACYGPSCKPRNGQA